VRRLIAVLSAVALALGLTLVVAGPASADLTAPGANAVLRGNATLSDSGGYDDSTLDHCSWFGGSGGDTRIELVNAAGQSVVNEFWNTGGARSVTIDTHNYPNGAYTVRGTITIRKNSGFLGTGCKNEQKVTTRAVTIQNITSIAYTGVTTAAATTSVTVSAKLTDPNKSPTAVNGKTVSFTLSGGATVTDATDANGIATATLPIAGPPRTATITAKFNGDAYYVGDSDAATFAVTRQATRTTVTQPAAVVHGQPTSFTAAVAVTQGTGTPTGAVQFQVDGADLGAPVALTAGIAPSAAPSTLSTGPHAVTAVYAQTAGYDASTSASVNQVVDKAATTTALTRSPDRTTVHGETVTFTATVDVVAPGAGQPGGGVQFTVDGLPAGTAVPLSGDTATLQLSSLHAGNHDVVATYNGNADFAASTANTITQGVDRAQTSLQLSTSDASAVSGQPLTYTAQVAPVGPGAGNPSGDVQFFADGNPIGDPVPLDNGAATSASVKLLRGTHAITANYVGDADFAGSNDVLQQVVAEALTTTSVSTTPNPSVFGQAVTARAEVAVVNPGTGNPDGAIRFVVDGATVDIVDLTDGAAELSLTGLAVGDHSVKAVFLTGDANFATSTSETLTQSVNKAATKTTVTSSSSPSVYGQPVTFTATVSVVAPGAGSPTGTITFTDGTRTLGTVHIDSTTDEKAQIQVSDLAVGQHAVVATYDGDGSFQGSTGSVGQTVQRARTATVVTSSANPAQSGQAVAFTAQVSPVAPGAGDPTGTVTFTVNGVRLGNPVTVVDGTATSSTFASLSPGRYSIEATYSGDRNFVGSAGSLDQGTGLDVVRGETTMTLGSGPDPAAFGAPVTFTATVTAVAPATGRPTGVVRFWEGDVLLGTAGLVQGDGSSAATYVSSTLSPGVHEVRAEYVGNYNFNPQTASTSQDVGTAATVTGLQATPNPATFGQDVTLTAVVTGEPGAPGSPTGSVTFRDGATVLGTAPVTSVQGSRQASLTVPGLHAGDHALTASYSGDASYAGSTSSAYGVHVDRAASVLVADTVLSQVGDNAGEVSATLTGNGGAPLAGQVLRFTVVQITDHSTIQVCDAVTGTDGTARCDATTEVAAMLLQSAGRYEVDFAGNADHLPAHDQGTWEVGR
jgi:hypothetical protein